MERYNQHFTPEEREIFAEVFGPVIDAVDLSLPDWRARLLEGLHYTAGLMTAIAEAKTIENVEKAPVLALVDPDCKREIQSRIYKFQDLMADFTTEHHIKK